MKQRQAKKEKKRRNTTNCRKTRKEGKIERKKEMNK